MKLITILCWILVSSFSSYSFANLPPNDLNFQDNERQFINGVTEEDFKNAMDEIQIIYGPIIEKLGYKLSINGDWDNSTVNAYAYQNNKNWHVQMFGGLARRKEITINGFKLVICHEIAHHIGGYPTSDWAAIEGQADYIAAMVCAKKVFKNAKTDNINSRCKIYKNIKEQNICSITLDAGQSLANLLAAISFYKNPNYDTPDTKEVQKTAETHPRPQCRLDTYLSGAVCNKKWNDYIIPTDGEAVCQNRPRCWFFK